MIKNEIDMKKIKFVDVTVTKKPVLDKSKHEIESLGKSLGKGKAQELLASGDYQKAAVAAIEEVNYQK